MLTATKVSQALDISVPTLNAWYRWYSNDKIKKPENTPFLPPFIQAKPRGTRYWKESDIKFLQLFKEWLPKGRAGVMGDYNYRFWGERGKRAQKNKRKNLQI